MNNYHIYEAIGKGVHSVVYKGRKKQTIEYYAIKSVQKSQKQRVHQEVKTIHDLKHPNILLFHNWYETGNHLWLILEYCVGGDLKSLLHQDMRLPETSVHDFGRDLLAALQYLHSRSIIHCDIKPSNVLLDENGSIKLGGFSVSRKLSDINKTPLSSLPPASRGTPAYMAPELFQEGATHSTASDLWAFGCVLYECYVGRPPFMNPSFNQLVQNILNSDFAAMSGASPEFTDLVNRLLDKNPATRMCWAEMLTHPFWQFTMSPVQMPPEPALERFIAAHGLAPADQENVSRNGAAQADERAKIMRQSVDITRLSLIVRGNLEKDHNENAEFYAGAQANATDIKLDNADAELDFEIRKEEEGQSDQDVATADLSNEAEQPMTPQTISAQVAIATQAAQPPAVLPRPATTNDAVPAADRSAAPSAPDDSGPTVSARPATVPNGIATNVPEVPLVALDKLILHSSDLAVKPLVGNKRIERIAEVRWEARMLPPQVQAWDLPTLLAVVKAGPARASELQGFLSKINTAVAGPLSLQTKVNLLAYFESLCTDGGAANALINTSLTATFVRLLGHTRNSSLRVRLASVLGLLIRHATFIDDSLARSGIVDTLREALNDGSEKVRRRVMATLGELLFYIATIESDSLRDGHEPSQDWQVSPDTITAVVRLLRPGEDEYAQHYAAKTVDNIATQLGAWPERFATEETLTALLALLRSARNDVLKATAGSALGRLLRVAPRLVSSAANQGALATFREGMSHSSVRMQIVALNLLNWTLHQPELRTSCKAMLQNDRSLVAHVMGLLEHNFSLVRAKALLTLALLGRLHPSWALEACQLGLPSRYLRLQADKEDDYVQRCLVALRHSIVQLLPAIFAEVGACLQSQQAAATPPSSRQRSPLALFEIVLHLMTSPVFRPKVVNPLLIRELSRYIVIAWSGTAPPIAATPEFRDSLMHVLEALCQPPDLLVVYCEAIVDDLLPALCQVTSALLTTSSDSESLTDLRVNSARMMADILMFFLNQPDLYRVAVEPLVATGGVAGTDITAKIDALLTAHVIPLLPSLMAERDPMPLYAQKVLATLLPRSPQYVADIEKAALVTRFFQFLSIESPNNNIHNIRVCRMIVACGSVSAQQLFGMEVANKVSHVLEYAHRHQVEPFLEPTVELCLALLMRDLREVPEQAPGAGETLQLVTNVASFVIFAGAGDSNLAATAAHCASALAELFPNECAEAVLSDECLDTMVASLSGEGAPPSADVLQHLLAMLIHCGHSGRSSASPEAFARLHAVIVRIRDSVTSGELQALASEAADLFG